MKLKWFGLVAAIAMFAAGLPANAQNYPNKPIRIVVGFAPGGVADVSARLLAPKLSMELGVPVTVENRPGAAGHVGAGVVAKSDPDGYTLFFSTPGTIGIAPHFRKDMAFHTINDFEYISFMSYYHNVLLGNPSFAKDMKTWVEKVKAAPGKYNASTVGIGALQHIYFIVQNDLLGLKMEFINYNGPVQANSSVATGENAIAFSSVLGAKAQIDSGQVVPLAVTGAKRSKMLPNVPTLAEAGFPQVLNAASWGGRQFVMAPKGTPKPIISRLHAALHKVMQDPDIKARLVDLDLDDLSSIASEVVGAEMKGEYETWGTLIKKYDIKDQ